MVKKLNLNAIRIDGATQPRERINMEAVGDYAEAVKVGIEFPPIVVFHDGAEHWLADGFHRYHAHKQAGKASISADVRNGTLLDAKLYAVGANGAHGLRRSNDDKRRAVQMVLDEPAWKEWSDRKVAEACGVSVPFVSAIRRPEVAQRQQDNRAASASRSTSDRNPITPAPAPAPSPAHTSAPATAQDEYFGPSVEEIAAAQREQEEELASLRRIADSDDKLKAALEENKRLRAQIAVMQERVNSLLNEKNVAIAEAKRWKKKAESHDRAAA